jgi:hypothetical protein
LAAGDISVGWDDSLAGPALFVASEAPPGALAVYPHYADSTFTDTTTFDLSTVKGVKLDLFARSGQVGSANVTTVRQPRSPAAGCTGWPSVTITITGQPQGRSKLAQWTVAFLAGLASALPLDSLDSRSRTDSARLTAEITRLAASAPNDTATSFHRVPFVVRTVRRFTPADGVEAVVAEVVRKINQEANPRQEQMLIVGERRTGSNSFGIAYAERAAGLEEALVATDVLAAVKMGPERRATLVLGRDEGDGGTYAWLERIADRKWRIRWTSAYAGC